VRSLSGDCLDKPIWPSNFEMGNFSRQEGPMRGRALETHVLVYRVPLPILWSIAKWVLTRRTFGDFSRLLLYFSGCS
jgi:hypothetical protein